ncbi:MAG: SDR family oxidoreductase [Sporomusaceae bacterium]|nr:SDR family oxidoreductase [Sporomusaceae bacterium]
MENCESSFLGKVILITGGTSGIGLASAQKFLAKGAMVVLVGRNEQKGREAIQILQNQPEVIYLKGDVRNYDACQQIVAETVRRFGRLDVLINSAGLYLEKLIDEMSEQDFADVMDCNIKGVYFMAKFAARQMRRNGGGVILNVSSDAGVQGNLQCSAYCASKGAVNIFTKALALELAPYKIRVNAVCPGDIATPLLEKQLSEKIDPAAAKAEMALYYPLGRIGTAEEVANVICFLASSEAAFVTGALWSVDGGITAC